LLFVACLALYSYLLFLGLPAGIIDPLLWWIAMPLMAPLLLAMLEGLRGWPRRDLFQQYSMGEEGG